MNVDKIEGQLNRFGPIESANFTLHIGAINGIDSFFLHDFFVPIETNRFCARDRLQRWIKPPKNFWQQNITNVLLDYVAIPLSTMQISHLNFANVHHYSTSTRNFDNSKLFNTYAMKIKIRNGGTTVATVLTDF